MSPLRKFILLLGTVMLVRVALAAAVPLFSVEAYYWLWGRHLALGYYDHPPMVAWVSAVLFGWIRHSELAVRAPAIILSAGSACLLYGLARTMFANPRVAWLTTAAYLLAPILLLGGASLQPDAPLIFFMTGTWLFFWRASQAENGGRGWWLAAGVFAGGALLSKFHAWVLLPPLWLFLLVSPDHRRWLRRPGPWLALVVALAVLLPNLIWNAWHDWITYTFQFRRSDLPESQFEIENVLIYWLGPFLTLSPLLYAAVLMGVWRGWQAWRRDRDVRWLYLLLAGVPLPLFLGLLSPLVTISVHWAAPAYGALILMAAALYDEGRLFRSAFDKRGLGLAGGISALASICLIAGPQVPRWLPEDARRNLVGWEAVAEAIHEHRQVMLEEQQSERVVVMADGWHLASLLAFHSGLVHETFVYEGADAFNFAYWMGRHDMLHGAEAVVVIDKTKIDYQHAGLGAKYDKYHRILDPLFQWVMPQPSIVCYADGSIEPYWGIDVSRPRWREFLLFRCYDFKGGLRPSDEGSD